MLCSWKSCDNFVGFALSSSLYFYACLKHIFWTHRWNSLRPLLRYGETCLKRRPHPRTYQVTHINAATSLFKRLKSWPKQVCTFWKREIRRKKVQGSRCNRVVKVQRKCRHDSEAHSEKESWRIHIYTWRFRRRKMKTVIIEPASWEIKQKHPYLRGAFASTRWVTTWWPPHGGQRLESAINISRS